MNFHSQKIEIAYNTELSLFLFNIEERTLIDLLVENKIVPTPLVTKITTVFEDVELREKFLPGFIFYHLGRHKSDNQIIINFQWNQHLLLYSVLERVEEVMKILKPYTEKTTIPNLKTYFKEIRNKTIVRRNYEQIEWAIEQFRLQISFFENLFISLEVNNPHKTNRQVNNTFQKMFFLSAISCFENLIRDIFMICLKKKGLEGLSKNYSNILNLRKIDYSKHDYEVICDVGIKQSFTELRKICTIFDLVFNINTSRVTEEMKVHWETTIYKTRNSAIHQSDIVYSSIDFLKTLKGNILPIANNFLIMGKDYLK